MIKKIILVLVVLISTICIHAQSKDETAVGSAVETLRKAMIDGDRAALESIAADQLSYGHSGGHIDDKKEFVEKIASGKSDFVTIELLDQTVSVSGKTAIVRHKLNATTNYGGRAAEVHLLVLLVWQKQHGKWVLLARQAVKVV